MPRLTYYTARDYTTQLRSGDGYHLLTPTATIAWLTEPLFPTIERFHSIFSLREHHTHEPFGGHLTIHLLQLSNLSDLPPMPPTSYAARAHRWGRFLMASSDAELDQIASEDPIMAFARRTLDHVSQDPDVQRRADERLDELLLYQNDLHIVRREGEAKGRAALLLKLLGLRFGPVPEVIRKRVAAATIEQLERWAERVLTAQTLDEALHT